MSSARMITILGTLRFSAQMPIFTAAIDKVSVQVITMSVVILCSKSPSKFMLYNIPNDEKRMNFSARISEIEYSHQEKLGRQACREQVPCRAKLSRVSHLPDYQSTF